jgi:hypothetical protein
VLKTLIIATVLLPRLAIAQQSENYRNRDSPADGARGSAYQLKNPKNAHSS